MKIRPTIFGLLKITVALFYLTGCGNAPNFSLGADSTISISPLPASVPVNGTVTFTATTANITPPLSWSLLEPGVGGTLSGATGNSVTYTAPATPPIYATSPSLEGMVTLEASAGASAGGVVSASTSFPITAPTVTVGLSPTTASVALSGTQQFSGYAVGNVNNAVTWQVNGVTGGSAAIGTITNTVGFTAGGLYSAPANMPMSGPTVTITVISQADPTKSQTAVVTLH
jgi:hypothetical protein